jgi:hypothetical protein
MAVFGKSKHHIWRSFSQKFRINHKKAKLQFIIFSFGFYFVMGDSNPTVCVSRWWAGVDSLREQEKPEARKMLENGAESHQSAARCVSLRPLY